MPLLPGDPAQLAAHHVHRPVPGQHGQVGAQLAGGRVVAVRVAPQLDEHVLHHVLRGGALAENAQRGTVDGRRQAVEDLLKSLIIAGRQARRQQRV